MSAAPLPPFAHVPPDLRRLDDYDKRAPEHLAAEVWAHIAEGAGEGSALRENRAAFARWRLLPRALGNLAGGNTRIDLPDGHHAAPILLAPLAYAGIAHPDGERAIVGAATAIGLGTVLSTLSTVTLEEVATTRADAAAQLATPPAPLWFQLYLQPDREHSLALVRRAEAAGCSAIVLTIDAGVKRSGFALPPGIAAANLAGMAQVRQTSGAGRQLLLGTPLTDAVPTWADLAWLRSVTGLPLIVKGMVVGTDIDRLIDVGADGLILSNHGGRVLDALPSALDVLPLVREQAGERLPLLVDGGIRSGSDVVKALCLGARAVLVGRPVLHGLAVAGVAGVAHVLHVLRVELEETMAQLGCPTIAQLTPERLLRL